MATFYSDSALDSGLGAFACEAGEVKAIRGVITLPATLGATDVVHMVKLPAEHVPVDLILEADDLDTNGTPTIVMDVGITSDSVGSTEDDDAFIAASTLAQGGGMARMDQVTGPRIAAVANERLVGITVDTAAATAAAGDVAVTLLYRAKMTGE